MTPAIKFCIGVLAGLALTLALAAGARAQDTSANTQAPVTASQSAAAEAPKPAVQPSHEELAKEMEEPDCPSNMRPSTGMQEMGPKSGMMGMMGMGMQGRGKMPMPGMGMPGMEMMGMPMMHGSHDAHDGSQPEAGGQDDADAGGHDARDCRRPDQVRQGDGIGQLALNSEQGRRRLGLFEAGRNLHSFLSHNRAWEWEQKDPPWPTSRSLAALSPWDVCGRKRGTQSVPRKSISSVCCCGESASKALAEGLAWPSCRTIAVTRSAARPSCR